MSKDNHKQFEFIDVRRGSTPRASGTGEEIDGAFVYTILSQRVEQVAYTLGCDRGHIYHLIEKGEFPNARDISTPYAPRAYWRIPRTDVLEFIERRKVGVLGEAARRRFAIANQQRAEEADRRFQQMKKMKQESAS